MSARRNKILIAIDGSNQAFNAVRYIGGLMPPSETKVVLFHVKSDVSDAYWGLESDVDVRTSMTELHSWHAEQDRNVSEFMEEAKAILLEAGFSEDGIELKIQQKKVGIARDIILESRENYNAVVVGRTGLSKLKDIFFGSIASRVLGKIREIPLIVVSETPKANKLLVAFDDSAGTRRSLAAVESLVDKSRVEMFLCHVIVPPGVYPSEGEAEWVAENKEDIRPLMNETRAGLIASGFPENMISGDVLIHDESRAEAIIDKSASAGYDTIVTGHRGLTFMERFMLGRVGEKIFKVAKNKAVWITV
ncbi:MAG: universal stress protein [Desulfobacterales bacterium]|nr:universal stress protein [Desulfobacterales bacterium]